MNIRCSTLLAALASLTTGPLAYTRDYAWSLLAGSWRATGLRQDDLKEVLRYCVAEGFMQLHGDEDEALYRLTDAGEMALDESRWFPWTRWRDQRVLEEARDRAKNPPRPGEPVRRGNDPLQGFRGS